MIDAELRKLVPPHVREDQIFDYDYLADYRIERAGDVQLGYHALHSEAPDIFYSPHNGGFWVITRLDLMSKVLPDTVHFSNRVLEIPRIYSDNLMIPLNLDPPDHLPFRMVLMRHFDPKSIRAMEPTIRSWANRLIDAFIDKGGCEFAEQIGAGFPVSVFMQLMGYPLERFEEFRNIMHDFFSPEISAPDRVNVQNRIIGIVSEFFAMRRKEPRDDLLTKLLNEKVNGRPLTNAELGSIGFLLFLAGLDTVPIRSLSPSIISRRIHSCRPAWWRNPRSFRPSSRRRCGAFPSCSSRASAKRTSNFTARNSVKATWWSAHCRSRGWTSARIPTPRGSTSTGRTARTSRFPPGLTPASAIISHAWK